MGNTSVKPHPRTRHKKQVHWKAADRPSPPGKPQLVSESEITPDVVTIRWDPPRYDGGSPITGYLVEHRRYGSPHWVRATPLIVPFNKLSLSGLEPGWRYQFRISAENAVGLSLPGELSELLTVTLQRSAIAAPRFIDELTDTVALENDKIEFTAQFIGQPAPKISWFKDGFEIFSSRRIRIITENDKSVLTIHQAALEDEGEIKCTATNRAGHASTKSNLTLEASPSIRLPRQYEDGLLFELGEVMRLKVSIAGRPTPLVFWSHNNESIKNDDRYEIENTDKYSSIRLEEAQRTDRGEYQVKAVNKLGEAVTSFLVTVTDKPSPPGQARVVMTLGRSVTLSWTLPADDGGCKIGNYIVEYFRMGWDVWLKAATCRQLTTTIGDLIEGSEYKFRVKAESPYGVSDPSSETDVVFIPDPKRGILTLSTRSKSQPRDIITTDLLPRPTKRQPRSLSSTRGENITERITNAVHFYDGGVPVRPTRTKLKSPSITPEPSPRNNRRNINADVLDQNMFDRLSVARDLAYGTPEMKVRQNQIEYESEKLNELRNNAIKSTINVIHHQNTSPVSINQDAPKSDLAQNKIQLTQESTSPSNHKSSFPLHHPRSSSPLPKSRRSPSPASKIQKTRSPFQPESERSPSPPNKTQKTYSPSQPLSESRRSPSPSNEIQKTHSPLQPSLESRKSPSPLNEMSKTHSLIQRRRRQSDSEIPSNRNNTANRALGHLRHIDKKSRSPSPVEEIRHEPINPRFHFNSTNSNEQLSNSSEFMLVLLPENQRGRGSASDIKFDFDENSVPPPMSLSAPELGAEPLFLEPIRSAVSSTELLHEKAMQRFYQALEAEDAELDNKKTFNAVELPKIQINSKDNQTIVGLERKDSLRRRLSAGGLNVPQQLLWAQRRHSLRNSSDLSELPENNLRKHPELLNNKIVEDHNKGDPIIKEQTLLDPLKSKRESFATRQRSESEEREEEEFEKVRAKMALKKKEPRKGVEVVKEEEWDVTVQDYEESVTESESESSEDERIYDEVPPQIKHIEEDIYHPPMNVKAVSQQKSIKDEPFEILTKPNPLPDPNFKPKPILKRRAFDEDNIVRKAVKQKNNTSVLQERSLPKAPKASSNFKEANKLEANLKKTSLDLFPQKTQPKSKKSKMKKRALSPVAQNRNMPLLRGDMMPNFPHSPPIPTMEPPRPPKRTNEEIRVMVDHYGDILKSYGQKKKSLSEAYLNTDELKAAAERQSEEELREMEKTVLDDEKEESDELQTPVDSEDRRRSFVFEASSALFKTVKDKMAAAFAGDPIEDDIIPPDEEIIPSRERRGSSQILKRRSSRSPSKVETLKSGKRGGGGPASAESNWSNLRSPSPTRQVRKASPNQMRRTSLIPPTAQTRRTSLGSISPQLKPKMRETTTQTPGDSSMLDAKRGILYAARQEELTAKAEYKVRTTVDYITDLAMFIVACWLYLFQNELLAIPVLLVMVYRQLKEEIKKKLPSWMGGKKKVKRK